MNSLNSIIKKLTFNYPSLRLLHKSENPIYYIQNGKNYYLLTFIYIGDIKNNIKTKIKKNLLYKNGKDIHDLGLLNFLKDFNSKRGSKNFFLSIEKGQKEYFDLINNGLELFMQGGSSVIFKNKNNKLIKILKNTSAGRKERFCNEINFINNCSRINGVMKIIEPDIDDKKYISNFDYYYYLNKGEPSNETLENWDIFEIIKNFIPLVKTLKMIHKKKIYHLDIKPDNIVWHEGRFKFIDFGIAHKDGVSDENTLRYDINGLGAKFTMAPEMKRNPLCKDYEKADIYSLIKTLWLFLTKDLKGFEGQYDKNNRFFGLKYYHSEKNKTVLNQIEYNIYYDNLELVLTKCTDENPQRRLSLEQIIENLEIFLKSKDKKLNSQDYFRKKAINEIIKAAIIKYPANNLKYKINENEYIEDVIFEEDLYRDLEIYECCWEQANNFKSNGSDLIYLIVPPIYRYNLNFKYYELDMESQTYISKGDLTSSVFELLKNKKYMKIYFENNSLFLETEFEKIKFGY